MERQYTEWKKIYVVRGSECSQVFEPIVKGVWEGTSSIYAGSQDCPSETGQGPCFTLGFPRKRILRKRLMCCFCVTKDSFKEQKKTVE